MPVITVFKIGIVLKTGWFDKLILRSISQNNDDYRIESERPAQSFNCSFCKSLDGTNIFLNETGWSKLYAFGLSNK